MIRIYFGQYTERCSTQNPHGCHHHTCSDISVNLPLHSHFPRGVTLHHHIPLCLPDLSLVRLHRCSNGTCTCCGFQPELYCYILPHVVRVWAVMGGAGREEHPTVRWSSDPVSVVEAKRHTTYVFPKKGIGDTLTIAFMNSILKRFLRTLAARTHAVFPTTCFNQSQQISNTILVA